MKIRSKYYYSGALLVNRRKTPPVILERFQNPTITDTVTVCEHPRVTSSLSVFVNTKPVKIVSKYVPD